MKLKKLKPTELKKVPELGVKKQQQKKQTIVVTAFDGLDPLSAALSAAASSSSSAAEAAAFAEAKSSKISSFSANAAGADDTSFLPKSGRTTTFIEDDFTGWPVYRSRILNKFNTAEKSLSIRSSYLSNASSSSSASTFSSSTTIPKSFSASSSISQKVRDRLEELDDGSAVGAMTASGGGGGGATGAGNLFEDGAAVTEMGNLSQPEFVKRLEELKAGLVDAWEADQKVKALKMAIQCAKQLSSTAVLPYYPSKWALISDILDTFGGLVYRRLLNKANETDGGGGGGSNREEVQETCRNWFFKISSIRELLPRFYIEAAILRVYSFLVVNEDGLGVGVGSRSTSGELLAAQYEAVFSRLSRMVRGIGDPLVATYCRVYLARVAVELAPRAKAVFTGLLYDTFRSVGVVSGGGGGNQLLSVPVQQTLNGQKVDYRHYYTLFTPALDWMLACALYKADGRLLEEVVDVFRGLNSSSSSSSTSSSSCSCSSLLLNSLLTAYPPAFILAHLRPFFDFIKHVDKDCFVADEGHGATAATAVYPQHLLVKALGEALKVALASSSAVGSCGAEGLLGATAEERRQVLADVWRITRKLKTAGGGRGGRWPAEYLSVLDTWAEIVAGRYGLAEVNELLGDVVAAFSSGGGGDSSSSSSNSSSSPPSAAALFSVLAKVVRHGAERFHYSAFFSMSNLMAYLDLLHGGASGAGSGKTSETVNDGEQLRVDACKLLVEAFIRSFNSSNSTSSPKPFSNASTEESEDLGEEESADSDLATSAAATTADPVILNSLSFLCKSMHDSITALTLEDDKRQMAALIIGFLRRVSYGRDFEAQLAFLVEARASFAGHLDAVLAWLVQAVARLAMETHAIVGGHHTKRTAAFVNGCIAYAYITVPSIEEAPTRLWLYLTAAQVTLVNGALPQTDAFLKAAITLLRQLPPTTGGGGPGDVAPLSNDDFLVSYVGVMLSTLLVVPVSGGGGGESGGKSGHNQILPLLPFQDNPELGPLYLFKGLYNVLKEYPFEYGGGHGSNAKFAIWASLLRFLVTATREEYPYHVKRVDSNDALYAQETAFITEATVYADLVFAELMEAFKQQQKEGSTGGGGGEQLRRQFANALELISVVLATGNAHQNSHAVNQLWGWVTKNQGRVAAVAGGREWPPLERRMVSRFVSYCTEGQLLLK